MNSRPEVRALVIGGGVVGCAVLFALAKRGIGALLVEADLDVGAGTSKANSAIVHTGFDAKPGSQEAALLRRAAALWPSVIAELEVPYLPVGALMLARNSTERDRLGGEIAVNAAAQGVQTELLERHALREIAPYVAGEIVAALSIPGEGVIDPFWLTRAYAEAAIAYGAQISLGRAVVSLDLSDDKAMARLTDGTRVIAEQAFNCAGLASDAVARLSDDDSFAISPRKGQFLVSEETFGVDRIVLPIPGPMGKGMLVTPIVFGGVLLGPTAEDQEDKSDRSATPEARERILSACEAMVPAVAQMAPIRQFAGVRAVSSIGDYILRPATGSDRLFHVAGIRSTGISASPAIAEFVVDWAVNQRRWPTAPRAAKLHRATALPDEAGEVVCLCRSISRGEVDAACRRPIVARTLDGLKRRSGVAFGDCQGNLCSVRVAEAASAAWDGRVETVVKHRPGSWLFAGAVPPTMSHDGTRRPVLPDGPQHLVVIGGGLAGVGVALAALHGGLRPLLIERADALGGALRFWLPDHGTNEERAALANLAAAASGGRVGIWHGGTAVGILPDQNGWRVLVQDALGMGEVAAERVVLATGGYIQPREHLPIAGPRGSGVVTADFVHAALDRGLLPGRRAVVVGSGRCARAAGRRLGDAGIEVRAELDWENGPLPVTAVRGDRRLEAVLIGDGWVQADTLVLAHRLLPMAFLLRGLGLVDGRPDQPAPIDEHNATPLPRLWAVGSCSRPDIDHAASLADGLELGARLAAVAAPAS